jgi:hypothetical protein
VNNCDDSLPGRQDDRSNLCRSKLYMALAALLWMIALMTVAGESASVPVRFPEGLTHGFLIVRSATGDIVAQGELTQIVKEGGVADSRLAFRFKDRNHASK